MSRKCELTGKKKIKGMSYSFLRSHYNPTAKRTFEVNLQTVRTTLNGKKVKLKVAASTIKSNPEIKAGINTNKKKVSRRRLKKMITKLTASAN